MLAEIVLAHGGKMTMDEMMIMGGAVTVSLGLPIGALVYIQVKRRQLDGGVEIDGLDGPARDEGADNMSSSTRTGSNVTVETSGTTPRGWEQP